MRKLVLETLKCHKTEDWTGADECRLEVKIDGVLLAPLRRSLNDGQKWFINQSFSFGNNVEIKLWDEDSSWPDDADFLGMTTVDREVISHASAQFTQNDAKYTLWYSVEDIPVAKTDRVSNAISQFESSPKPGVWPYIPKGELIADIRKSVVQPFSVAQGSTPFCGPAAIIFELVSRQPERYVQICQQLYEAGSFRGREKLVKPAEALTRSRVRSGITVADWMLMAALRDTENALFDVDSESGQFVAGISTPWEMKGWTRELLGYDRVDFESTFVYGEFEAMKYAKRVRNQGGVAFLMIHSSMLRSQSTLAGYPDHWVSFLGDLRIDDGIWWRWDSGHIAFNCYSWGTQKHVDIGEGLFEDRFWGVVTGLP